MTPLKLITFDFTGTLFCFKVLPLEKYYLVAREKGIITNKNVIKQKFKEAYQTVDRKHPNFGKSTGFGWQKWWRKVIENTFAGFVEPNDLRIEQIANELIAYYSGADAYKIRPGTTELLKHLKEKNFTLGVISNNDTRVIGILEFVNLKHYFDFILLSYNAGYRKPDRRIFEEALRLGNCSKGTEAVHIGDDLKKDYYGAKNVGMCAIFISDGNRVIEEKDININEVFNDFFSLKNYFETMQ